MFRDMRFAEERGTGIDKVITAIEEAQLPAPEFRENDRSFVATLFGPREFSRMTTEERVRACYQHSCLQWVAGNRSMTNSSLRERFGLEANQAASISRLFSDVLERGLIKPADPGNQSRSQASYVPYWA